MVLVKHRVESGIEVEAGGVTEQQMKRLRGSFRTARNSLRISATMRSNEASMSMAQESCLRVAHRVAANRAAAITPRTARLSQTTPPMSPARYRVCISETAYRAGRT